MADDAPTTTLATPPAGAPATEGAPAGAPAGKDTALPAKPADGGAPVTAKQLEELTPAEVEALAKNDPKWGRRFEALQRQLRATRTREEGLTAREKQLLEREAKATELEKLREEFKNDPFAVMQKLGVNPKTALDRFMNDGKPSQAELEETREERISRLEKEIEDRKAAETAQQQAQHVQRLQADIAKVVIDGGEAFALIAHFGQQDQVLDLMRDCFAHGNKELGLPAKSLMPIAKAAELVETRMVAQAKALQERFAKAPKLGAAAPVVQHEAPKSTDTRTPSDPADPPAKPSARKVSRPVLVDRVVKKPEKKISPQEHRAASLAAAMKKLTG